MTRRLVTIFVIAAAALEGQTGRTLRVGVGGTQPFVVQQDGERSGIAVEIWEAAAAQAGWRFEFQDYASAPEAMDALRAHKLDVVVGPVSITAERAAYSRFSQPFFASHIAILSRTEPPHLWQRIAPFFSRTFFVGVASLLMVLAVVGTLIWLAERRGKDSSFPQDAFHGIGNGIWFAIVTMSTVGYGDMAPRTVMGRAVTGVWIIISVIAATSLVAGIASTLTLTGIGVDVIATADQLKGRRVAALGQSPGEAFANRFGAQVRSVASLVDGYNLLEQNEVDALVYDKPQLQYFLRKQNVLGLAVSEAEYEPQNYGFALAMDSPLQHELNLQLLRLHESGMIDRIAANWLGSATGRF